MALFDRDEPDMAGMRAEEVEEHQKARQRSRDGRRGIVFAGEKRAPDLRAGVGRAAGAAGDTATSGKGNAASNGSLSGEEEKGGGDDAHQIESPLLAPPLPVRLQIGPLALRVNESRPGSSSECRSCSALVSGLIKPHCPGMQYSLVAYQLEAEQGQEKTEVQRMALDGVLSVRNGRGPGEAQSARFKVQVSGLQLGGRVFVFDIEATRGGRMVTSVIAQAFARGGPESAPRVRTVDLPPTAPRDLACTHSSADCITLRWRKPVCDGGSDIVSYRVQRLLAAEDRFVEVFAGPGRSASLKGLAPGTELSFRVCACNAALGPGEWTPPIKCATLAVAPGAPSAPAPVEGTVAPHRLEIAWDAPARDGGAPIDRYRVELAQDAKGNDFETVYSGPARRCVLDNGIEPAKAYLLRVRAENAVGVSLPSRAARVCSLGTVPAPPAAPKAEEISTGPPRMAVCWVPPDALRGSAVKSFALELRAAAAAGESSEAYSVAYSGPDCACELEGLEAGAIYELRVLAQNLFGWSDPSPETRIQLAPSEPGRPPVPPSFARTSSRGIELTLAALPERLAHGNPVVEYPVWARRELPAPVPRDTAPVRRGPCGLEARWAESAGPEAGAWIDWTEVGRASPDKLEVTLAGLSAGMSYSFRYAARNALGESGPSEALCGVQVDAAHLVAPPAPRVEAVDGKSARLSLLEPPSDAGAAEHQGWHVAVSPAHVVLDDDGRAVAVEHRNLFKIVKSETSSECLIELPRSGAAYAVRTRCFSSAGCGPWSAATGFVADKVAPGPPIEVAISVGQRAGALAVSASWSPPEDTGGAEITGFKVETCGLPLGSSTPRDFAAAHADWLPADARTLSLADIAPACALRVRVRARNACGAGSAAEAAAEIPAVPPGPTAELEQTGSGPTWIKCKWAAPDLDGGQAIIGYETELVRAEAPPAPAAREKGIVQFHPTEQTRAHVKGLDPAQWYQLRVRGVNAAGSGAFGPWVAMRTQARKAQAPRDLRAASLWPLCFEWLPPESGGEVIEYHLHLSGAPSARKERNSKMAIAYRGSEPYFRLPEARPGHVYRARVCAVTPAGASSFGPQCTVRTPEKPQPVTPPRPSRSHVAPRSEPHQRTHAVLAAAASAAAASPGACSLPASSGAASSSSCSSSSNGGGTPEKPVQLVNASRALRLRRRKWYRRYPRLAAFAAASALALAALLLWLLHHHHRRRR